MQHIKEQMGNEKDQFYRFFRDKASSFEEGQVVRLIYARSAACKSDIIISESLRTTLKDGAAHLLEERKARQCYNPSQTLLELVDPRISPLIYGKTLVSMGGGQVDLLNCFESYGSGQPSPLQPDKRKDSLTV